MKFKYSVTISAFSSALCFIFSAQGEGLLRLVLAVAGAMLCSNAFYAEGKMERDLDR